MSEPNNLSPETTFIRELSEAERILITNVRVAVHYDDRGDPIKDVLDDREIADALRLLVAIVATGVTK